MGRDVCLSGRGNRRIRASRCRICLFLEGCGPPNESAPHNEGCSPDAAHCNSYNEGCSHGAGHCNRRNQACPRNAARCNCYNEGCSHDAVHCNSRNGGCSRDMGHCNSRNRGCFRDMVHCNSRNGGCSHDAGHCNSCNGGCSRRKHGWISVNGVDPPGNGVFPRRVRGRHRRGSGYRQGRLGALRDRVFYPPWPSPLPRGILGTHWARTLCVPRRRASQPAIPRGAWNEQVSYLKGSDLTPLA